VKTSTKTSRKRDTVDKNKKPKGDAKLNKVQVNALRQERRGSKTTMIILRSRFRGWKMRIAQIKIKFRN
jgi:hypothetical protein